MSLFRIQLPLPINLGGASPPSLSALWSSADDIQPYWPLSIARLSVYEQGYEPQSPAPREQALSSRHLTLRFSLPAIIALYPLVWQIDNCARLLDRFQGSEGIFDNLHLEFKVKWFPRRVPQGEVYENRPGWLHRLGDIPCRTHRNCWYPSLLHYSGDQSHGLMANRSGRNKEEDIHTALV